MYTVVHDAAIATWEGIKDFGRRAVQKAVALDAVLERYGVGSIQEMDDTTYRKVAVP